VWYCPTCFKQNNLSPATKNAYAIECSTHQHAEVQA
jgi:hypothetical protein